MIRGSTARHAFAVTGIVLALTWSLGCAPLDLGAQPSFDDWYAGRGDDFDVDEIGVHELDGSFGGWLLNDVLLRAPVYVVYEGAYALMLPVALPYFGLRSLTTGAADTAGTADTSDNSDGGSGEEGGSE